MFDDQRYEESIQTLTAALVRPGNTPEEKIAILKLLAYNDIAMGRNDEADAAVRGIYVTNEDYELEKSESPRFRDFFESTKKKWIEEGKPGKAKAAVALVEKPVKIAHASEEEAKLRLDERESALKPAKSGAIALVPGAPRSTTAPRRSTSTSSA